MLPLPINFNFDAREKNDIASVVFGYISLNHVNNGPDFFYHPVIYLAPFGSVREVALFGDLGA